jgi:hypothetical protein
MATVRFSDTLKIDIERNAKALFTEQIEKATESVGTKWADKIYNSMFHADDITKMNACPDWCFNTQDNIRLKGFYNHPADVYQTKNTVVDTWHLKEEITLTFSSARRMPAKIESANTGMKHGWREYTIDYDDSRYEWLKKEFKEYTRKIFEVKCKRDIFVDGIKEIMHSYSTLAPALKVFPALWDLLPQETKDRHKKIVERPKAPTSKELGADLSTMTATVTFNKLSKK